MTRLQKINPILFSGLFLGTMFLFLGLTQTQPTKQHTEPSIGNTTTLISAYERWKIQATRSGAAQKLVLPLSYSKALSDEFTLSKGKATLDLQGGILTIEASGLPDNESFNVFMVENRENVDSRAIT